MSRKRFLLFGLVFTGALALAGASTAAPNDFVAGSLILDGVRNQLSVSAHSSAPGGATGFPLLDKAVSGVHCESRPRIRITITCLVVSGNVAIAGGSTVGATAGLGTIHPQYSFVLEDLGPGVSDRWTIFAQFASDPANPCAEAFGPAVETSVRGNVVVNDG